ncbi:unnamed protein product, partial [marine sediment metagenome]
KFIKDRTPDDRLPTEERKKISKVKVTKKKLSRAVGELKKAADIGSKEFKKWFGNSKVVDGKGNPLVVYHGTTVSTSFEYFEDFSGGAGWFSESPLISDAYAGVMLEGSPTEVVANSRVLPVYLSIINPLDLMVRGLNDYDSLSATVFHERAGIPGNLTDWWEGDPFEHDEVWSFLATATLASHLRLFNFDGIKVQDDAYGKEITTWRVLSGKQIKSIFNIGTWSLKTGKMSYSIGTKEGIAQSHTG